VASWSGCADALEQDALERVLEELFASAREQWPDLAITGELFAAFLAERIPTGDPLVALRGLHARAGDLMIACGCVHGVPAALAAFDAAYLADCAVHLRRIDGSPAFADEVAQVIREKLLVRQPDRPPRIADYLGRGSLSGWVRVALMRTALNLRRAHTIVLAPDRRDLEIAASGDATLELAKLHHRDAFQSAVRVAVAQLDARQRTVLRLHYVDGLGIDKICGLYGVNRSTIARWLVDTREALRGAIRRELHRSLGVSGRECESLAGALYSQLTLSLASLLGRDTP
jgi:RNA polymerase sigma-70 factor, ECF subfamily